MTQKRSYHDACGAAQALNLVGERWALLVVRELLLGPKRFTDLRAGLPGISPNVLTMRLHELEQSAVLRRRRLPPPAGSWVYELTDWGQQLGPIISQLGRWAARSPSFAVDAPLGPDSVVLSFRAMFDPAASRGFQARFELRFGEDRFRVEVADGHLDMARGAAQHPDAVITTDPDTLAAVVYEGLDLAEAEKSGVLTIDGDRSTVERFLTLFSLPEPVPAARAETVGTP